MECAILAATLICATPVESLAQVRQSGNVTPTHATAWTTTGTVQDAGSETSPFVTTFGILNGTGTGLCVNSDKSTAAGYQRFCLGTTTAGGAVLSTQNFGTALAQGISFNINGTLAALATVVLPTVSGDGACFNNTTGTIIDCGYIPLTGNIVGQVSLVGVPRATGSIVDWTTYTAKGAVISSGTGTAIAQAAVNAAMTAVGTPGYDLEIIGCLVTNGYCGFIDTTTIVFPATEGKRVRAGSLLYYGVSFDSCMMCNYDFAGQMGAAPATAGVTFKPINPVTFDLITVIIDSHFNLPSLSGSGSTVVPLTFEAGTHGISQSRFTAQEAAYGLTNALLIKSPSGGGAFQNNAVTIVHEHDIAGGAGAVYNQIGNGAVGGTLANNFYDLTAVALAGTETAIDTYGSYDFIRLRVSSFTSGTTLKFESGACGNVVIIQTDQAAPIITDLAGSSCTRRNLWFVNGVANITNSEGGYIDNSFNRNVPTTGFSVTIGNTVYTQLLDPAGTLATGTLTLPSSPSSGQLVRAIFTQQVTALTLAPNSGQTISGKTTGLVAQDGMIECIYRSSSTSWFCSWNIGGSVPVSTLTGLGTGVATALAVNVGSAGAFVVNGGALGTPSSGTLTNATGLPISGLTGLGTGVATALAVNVGTAGAFVINGGALGTPSSGVLTSATGLPLTTGVTGVLGGANGGTTLSTAAIGDIMYASATTPVWSRLADVATGSLLASGGTNTAPAYCAACTLTTSLTVPVVIGSASAGAVGLELRSTSGVGNGDFVRITDGNNGGTEVARFTGTLFLIGGTVGQNVGGFSAPNMQAFGSSQAGSFGLLRYTTTGSGGAVLHLTSSNGAAIGTFSKILSGGGIGQIYFDGDTGATYNGAGAAIIVTATADWSTTSSPAKMSFYTTAAASIDPSATLAMSIDAAQRVVLAATTDASSTATGAFAVTGGMTVAKRVWMAGLTSSGATQTDYLCLSSGGEVIADTIACLVSSERFKMDIRRLPQDEVADLASRFVAKSWRYRQEDGSVFASDYYRERIGLVAEDVAEIDPRLVQMDQDGHPRAIDYNGVVTLLAAEVAKLRADLQRMENRR